MRTGDAETAAAATGEAARIAQRLGRQPQLDRADTTQSARSRRLVTTATAADP